MTLPQKSNPPCNNGRYRALLSDAVAFAVALGLSGCVNVQSNAFRVSKSRFPPKPPTAQVAVYRDAPPSQPYTVVARVNVHIEKTFFLPTAFDEALPKLRTLAREQGADALVDFHEQRSRINETFVYNVTASAVVLTPP
jgi:hypothetical protein